MTGRALSVLVLALVCGQHGALGLVEQLNDDTFDAVVTSHELVIVSFYADWCRFCQMLRPVFDQASELLKDNPKAKFGRVDCESPVTRGLKTKFGIRKYPTLKLFRHGQALKSEYRGQRSPNAIARHLEELLADPVVKMETEEQANDLITRKRKGVIGKFPTEDHAHYATFLSVSNQLRDECHFVAIFGHTDTSIHFRSKAEDFDYKGDPAHHPGLLEWVRDVCNPLVREITFENGEELTEEGLPFLILFHAPDDEASAEEFTKVVNTRFQQERGLINFIIADGHRFAVPLKHLGKTVKDLPVLAFDTFRHMYLFRKYASIRKPGRLEKFVSDLHKGTLHHSLHDGVRELDDSEDDDEELPDEPEKKETLKEKLEDKEEEKQEAKEMTEKLVEAEKAAKERVQEKVAAAERVRESAPHLPPVNPDEHDDDHAQPVPVKSVLRHLKPSENRYSFARNTRDEL